MATNDWNILLAVGLGLLAHSWLSQRATGQVPLFSGGGWGAGNLSWTNDEDVGLPGQTTTATPFATVGSTPTSASYNPYGYPTSITNINPSSWVNPPQLGVNGVTESVLAQYGMTANDIQPNTFISKNNANMANALTTITRVVSPPGAKPVTQISGINSKGKFYALPPKPKGYY